MGASRGLRKHQGSSGKRSGGPGTPQEQPRNEQREFQENRVFRPWEASGGPRGTQNRWGGLAGAKGKARVIPGHPKEEGRVLRFLGQPWEPPGRALKSRGLSGFLAIGFLGPGGTGGSLGGSAELRRAPGRLQEHQGGPRSSSEMSSASFRKIEFFGPGRRLAAPEGPRIAGGASLSL